jgi:hypothetical protein
MCDECPFSKTATVGWLGPHDPQTFVEITEFDIPFACHKQIPEGGWEEGKEVSKNNMCKGYTLMRINQCKSSRDSNSVLSKCEVDLRDSKESSNVFKNVWDFVKYHSK